MQAIIAITVVLLQEPTLSVPPRYYTLKEFAAAVDTPMLKVAAHTDCQDDVYALSFKEASWSKIEAAIEADKRLEVVEADGVRVIRRNKESEANDNNALKRYMNAISGHINAVFSGTIKRSSEIAAMPEEQRRRVTDALPAQNVKDPILYAIENLLYLFVASNDIPYASISIPAKATSGDGMSTFGKFTLGNGWTLRDLFMRDGKIEGLRFIGIDPQQLLPAEVQKRATAFQFGYKLTLDPLTISAAQKWIMYLERGDQQLYGSGKSDPIIPVKCFFTMSPEQVWTSDQRKELQERARSTDALFAREANLRSPTPISSSPTRLSALALLWAKSSGSDLVCHVPAFADYSMAEPDRASLASLVNDVNSFKLDQAWLNSLLRERGQGYTMVEKEQRFNPPRRVTVIDSAGVIVLRNEMRFLDTLACTPVTVPTQFENEKLDSRTSSLSELSKHLAGLDFSKAQNSFFSSNYLTYCNPISYKPIAMAYAQSPKLQSLFESASHKQSTIRFTDLEEEAQAALSQGLLECASLNDAAAGVDWDPMFAGVSVRDKKHTGFVIAATRTENVINIAITLDSKTLWRTWIRNVAP